MRAQEEQAWNDTITLHVPNTPLLSFSLSSISSTTWQFPYNKIFVFRLPNNFLTALTAATQPVLDIVVQDDTSVDFLRLEVCYIPPSH
jgi:hypothetical protein